MSEKEKKAIELLENFDVKFFLNGAEQSDFIIEKANKVNNAIDMILNLVEKQNEEIKGLHLDLRDMYISNNYKKLNWTPKVVLNSYVSKNKIRKKIKEYEGLKEIDKTAYEEQIKPLQELLEEDKQC